MTDTRTIYRADAEEQDEDDISLIDILIVLAERKKFIAASLALSIALALAVTFLTRPVFQTSATILPPQQQQSGAAAIMAQLGAAGASLGGFGGLKSPGDVYVGIMKSRTMADTLVDRFNLLSHYEANGSRQKARDQLEKYTEIKTSKEGLISVTVSDADPRKAAEIANAYIEELGKLSNVLAISQASRSRLFYEQQLKQAKDNLGRAEIALKRGLDTGGIVSVDVESKTIVETIARIRAQISAKEVQLNAMSSFVTTNNQEYKRAEEELASLRKQLLRLESGRQQAGADSGEKDDASFESIKSLRDVKYYQMLYELLAKQYELARLEEAKDPTLIQILDKAAVPERKIRPRPMLYMFIGILAGLIVGIGGAFALDRMQKSSADPATSQKLGRLRKGIRGK
jgi:uncharacterized protein involved in exopolysaccharide biosynthesis